MKKLLVFIACFASICSSAAEPKKVVDVPVQFERCDVQKTSCERAPVEQLGKDGLASSQLDQLYLALSTSPDLMKLMASKEFGEVVVQDWNCDRVHAGSYPQFGISSLAPQNGQPKLKLTLSACKGGESLSAQRILQQVKRAHVDVLMERLENSAISNADLDAPRPAFASDRQMEEQWNNCINNQDCHAAFENGDVTQVDINQAQPEARTDADSGH